MHFPVPVMLRGMNQYFVFVKLKNKYLFPMSS